MKTIKKNIVEIGDYQILAYDFYSLEFTVMHKCDWSISVYTNGEMMEVFGLSFIQIDSLKDILMDSAVGYKTTQRC